MVPWRGQANSVARHCSFTGVRAARALALRHGGCSVDHGFPGQAKLGEVFEKEVSIVDHAALLARCLKQLPARIRQALRLLALRNHRLQLQPVKQVHGVQHIGA